MKATRKPALVLAAATGLAGLGIGATLGPGVAAAATSTTASAVGNRVTAIKDALSGLVSDGTISQSQADKVASTLADKLPQHGPGGFGPGGFGRGANLEAAAKILGLTTDELRTQLQSGKSLADLAKAKGISTTTLVNKLLAAAKTELAAQVKAGKLTQAQADEFLSGLKERITERVTSTEPFGGHGMGGFGMGGHGHRWGGSGSTATPTPSGTAS